MASQAEAVVGALHALPAQTSTKQWTTTYWWPYWWPAASVQHTSQDVLSLSKPDWPCTGGAVWQSTIAAHVASNTALCWQHRVPIVTAQAGCHPALHHQGFLKQINVINNIFGSNQLLI